jgi:hypothetical protein
MASEYADNLDSRKLKEQSEKRSTEALKLKDDQIMMLMSQNNKHLGDIQELEEKLSLINEGKITVENANRELSQVNFDLQAKARAAETQSKRMTAEVQDKEKQLRIMTDQNSELLRLLESEESLAARLQSEVAQLRNEIDEVTQKYTALSATARTHEELATKAAKEGQLRAEEIRLLRAECEQLKQQNAELKMKTQVEVEALQEQLRVRKEKQYQLLEKLQAQEEAKRQAEDQVTGMEEQLRGLHARNVELETQCQVERRAMHNVEEANRELQTQNANIYAANKDLQAKIEKSEKERLRMEAEARDATVSLREMAEKVFQLLERLKLAELGKTKAMEAVKKKELDMTALKKKNDRLIKEATEEGKARVKAEMDIKVLQEQVRNIKKLNHDASQKLKEESREKVKLGEENEQLKEKNKLLETRLSFLLNKVQLDEEARVIQAEDRKKLEAQVISLAEKSDELSHKLTEMSESNKVITQAMRLKQEELNEMTARFEALMQTVEEDKRARESLNGPAENDGDGGGDGGKAINSEGRYFYVQAKTVGGGAMLLLHGRNAQCLDWLDGKYRANDFLKKAQKSTKFRDMIVEKLALLYGQLLTEEQEKTRVTGELTTREQQLENLYKKLNYLQDVLATEEDAKRRMLLRYIHAVKEHATAVTDGSGGILQLPESNISDEEVHALAALLRNNGSIVELNLRNNNITDDGARALGAVLAGKSALRLVDLRGNKIGPGAIRILAEALERAERVKHVYVHQGGKIEALGTNSAGASLKDPSSLVTVETVCVVDVRDNNAASAAHPYELEAVRPVNVANTGTIKGSKSAPSFTPGQMTNMPKTLSASADHGVGSGFNTTIEKKKKKPKPLNASSEPALTAKQMKKIQKNVRCK